MPSWKILQGNCLEVLRQLPDESVQTLVTSPPYYGLRDYGGEDFIWGGMPSCVHEWGEELPGSNRGGSGTPTNKNNRGEGYGRDAPRGAFCQRTGCGAWNGSLGLEPTPDLFVHHLVLIFREARRVLRENGTAWINMGDSYNTSAPGNSRPSEKSGLNGAHTSVSYNNRLQTKNEGQRVRTLYEGAKNKDLLGVPWMMAFALRADGWYLRSEIIWAKPSPMPESVRDRPTKSHEHVFLLAKSESYFYDPDAIREESAEMSRPQSEKRRQMRMSRGVRAVSGEGQSSKGIANGVEPTHVMHSNPNGRNARDVWTIATVPFPGAHFAVFPPALPERCILAGSAPGDTVMDVFNGSGTTGEAALKNGRNYIGIEQNPEFIKIAKARLIGTAKEDMRAGDFVFCPTCEAKGVTKLFERVAVEKAAVEGKKITCTKCMGRFTAADLGVST